MIPSPGVSPIGRALLDPYEHFEDFLGSIQDILEILSDRYAVSMAMSPQIKHAPNQPGEKTQQFEIGFYTAIMGRRDHGGHVPLPDHEVSQPENH